MRPGCDRVAAARLTYDTIGCQVWLDDLAERTGRNQEICILHAERLTVPRGWALEDRRSDEPPLFVPPPSAPAATRPRAEGRAGRRRNSSGSHPAAQTMELFEVLRQELAEAEAAAEPVPEPALDPVAETAPEPAPEPAPDPVPETVPEPVDDELPAALQATSPLLSRAFATTGHQRSVLTQRSPADPDAGGDGADA